MPVLDGSFEAFVTNLGKYNEGELVGEWVHFPTTEEEMKKVFERIGIGSKDEFGQVYAVQINFADDKIDIPCPGEIRSGSQARYIEENDLHTQWKLEASCDGENWFMIEDKTSAETDLSHDLVVRESGFAARWLRLSDMALPYGQAPCVSGLRVFGIGNGDQPAEPDFTAVRTRTLDMEVEIAPQSDAMGYNILFGASPDKLYHSYMVFTAGKKRIGALIAGKSYCVRVDAFNESGITEGKTISV